jgi:hypothetical protein
VADKWKQIEITNNNSVLKDLEIDLTQDTEDEDIEVKEKPNGDNTRVNVKANDRDEDERNVHTDEEDEDSPSGTEVNASKEEDAEERPQVNKGESRRSRTIRNLRARAQMLEQELAKERSEKNQLASNSRAQSAKYMTEQKEFWDKRTDQLEEELDKAITANDSKVQAKIQRALNEAQINQKIYSAASQEYETEEEDEQPQRQVQQQQVQQAPPPPEAARRWVAKNDWFMRDPALRHKVLQVNGEMLNEQEFDPADDDYYVELEKRLEDEGLNIAKLSGKKPNAQQQQRRSPVGGSSDSEEGPAVRRAGKGAGKTQFKRVGDKIEVTPDQEDYDMAERLGVPIKNYMKSKLIYESSGGRGYTDINTGKR